MEVDLNADLGAGGDQSDDTNGDGEGVWSPDIEQCFREALLLFPPCGRRKHILQEEGGGKMYGRNELIARHIMMRTGKSRTRKQVSSHIQVLARRKAKAEAASAGGGGDSGQSMVCSPSMTRSQSADTHHQQNRQQGCHYDVWMDRPIVSQKIRLVEFSAFCEYLNFQPATQVAGQQQPPPLAPVGGSPSIQQPASAMTTQDLCENLQQTSLDQQPLAQQQQQQLQTYVTSSVGATNTHPLGSNHQLPAQFNQATTAYHQTIVDLQRPQKPLDPHAPSSLAPNNQHALHHPPPTAQISANFTRHSYVQIDYRKTSSRQVNKLERINISQIQDKFPEIGGSDGLFQRGPSDAFFLVKFWADLSNDYEYNIDDQNSYFGFSSHFETIHPYKDITCSTKACSYGLQVVEKVEKIYGALNSSNGRYSYDIDRSPMCEFMIKFIKKLRQLPRSSQMNSVLENFTVLQVITSESTSEILLCLAYIFEVQNSGPQYHVYKLTKD